VTTGRVDPSGPLPYTSRATRALSFAAAGPAALEHGASDGLRLLRTFFLEDRNVAAGVLRKMRMSSA
jgi:hypothetical protein